MDRHIDNYNFNSMILYTLSICTPIFTGNWGPSRENGDPQC